MGCGRIVKSYIKRCLSQFALLTIRFYPFTIEFTTEFFSHHFCRIKRKTFDKDNIFSNPTISKNNPENTCGITNRTCVSHGRYESENTAVISELLGRPQKKFDEVQRHVIINICFTFIFIVAILVARVISKMTIIWRKNHILEHHGNLLNQVLPYKCRCVQKVIVA